MTNDNELTARKLKSALWKTLRGLRDDEVTPSAGDAVASQAREILRTVNTQLKITTLTHGPVSEELIKFAAE